MGTYSCLLVTSKQILIGNLDDWSFCKGIGVISTNNECDIMDEHFGVIVFSYSKGLMVVDIESVTNDDNETSIVVSNNGSLSKLFEEPVVINDITRDCNPTIEKLDKFVEFGVLDKEEENNQVCPKCSNPHFSVKERCQTCGSTMVHSQQLIHHFACGYVDFTHNFEINNGLLTCPKCRKHDLTVNIDFEFMTGLVECDGCGTTTNETDLVGVCGNCTTVFPTEHAVGNSVSTYTLRSSWRF